MLAIRMTEYGIRGSAGAELLKLAMRNYKPLKKFEFESRDLSVLLGANAAGKSNLVDTLDFITYVYRHGLECAVAGMGGYPRWKEARAELNELPLGAESWKD